MHQTANTSREAYKTINADGQYEAILAYLRKISPESSCIADTALALGWDKSTVSARFNELKNMEKIVYAGTRPSKRTGRTGMHWTVPEQETLFG